MKKNIKELTNTIFFVYLDAYNKITIDICFLYLDDFNFVLFFF